ncbi:MAG: twin-arginine translocase TatA/TatE family subunit [Pseudobdellovibrionaceae bacterium]|nr:twin-arginine translocase TatA/TatE family subunit [Bdellovibrionales bacterium]USN46883.1 MAG: twin-arginine translocase TatA/TatE family subunit [Pseudobdellovibrionaceae bacterium]
MFNFGFGELLVLAVLALFVIGPDRLPEAARKLASILNEFKRATGDFSKPFDDFKKNTNQLISKSQAEVQNQLDQVTKNETLDSPSDSGSENES